MALVDLTDGPADGVRILTLNDPDRRNALSPALQAELSVAVDAIRDDTAARVLVVAGNGPAFSAGADLPALFGNVDRDIADIRVGLHAIYDSFLRVRRLAIPTIAAVHGAAGNARCRSSSTAGPSTPTRQCDSVSSSMSSMIRWPLLPNARHAGRPPILR